MIWLRSLICLLGFIVISVIVTPLLLLISLPFWGKPYKRIIDIWCRIVLGWLRISAGIKYRIEGAENLRYLEDKPHVIVSNHQSTFETFLYSMILPPHAFVLKRELTWIPFFGWGLAKLKPIAINRQDGRNALKSIIAQAKEKFNEGRSVIIFPEGTRAKPDTVKPFKKGAFLMTRELGADMLPVAINSGRAWSKGRFLKYPGTITMVIGKPIPFEGQSTQELLNLAEAEIRPNIRQTLD